MPELSVVIITFNEERNIARCLESVKDIADEIIVVDSFSTDRTKEICQKYNVKFFQKEWSGYSQQKNYANSLASYNLIFSIDADEAVSETLKKSILKAKFDSIPGIYSLSRLTNYCGKWIYHCGWYPDKKIRLFNRNFAHWEGDVVHETIKYSTDIKINHLEGDLFHYSYYTISDHIKQANHFTDLTALEAFRKNKKSNLTIIIIKPFWKFIRDFFFKLGFLDGYYGFLISSISAIATYFKYVKLRELNKKA